MSMGPLDATAAAFVEFLAALHGGSAAAAAAVLAGLDRSGWGSAAAEPALSFLVDRLRLHAERLSSAAGEMDGII